MSNSIISSNGYNYPFPAIYPVTQFSAIEDLMNEVESYFSTSFVKKSFPYPIDIVISYNKKTNIPEQYLINIALAGFTKDEVSVKIIQNKAIRVELKPIPEVDTYDDDKYTFYLKYLSKGIAKREASYTWSLTPRIDAKNMLVKFTNGILSIALPIKNETTETEEVEVSIGD